MVLDMSFNSIFQMYHYLERTYQHVQTHKERLFDLHITEAMAKVFPKVNQMSTSFPGLPWLRICCSQHFSQIVKKLEPNEIDNSKG